MLFVIGAAPGARASEYGRKVLLCRASPASNGCPKGVPDCVPPIDQVYHELSRVDVNCGVCETRLDQAASGC